MNQATSCIPKSCNAIGRAPLSRKRPPKPKPPSGRGRFASRASRAALAGILVACLALLSGASATDAPLTIPVDGFGEPKLPSDFSVVRVWNVEDVAGTGIRGSDGDGGPATEARLKYPRGVALDADGNLYFADHFNHRIRRVDADGLITNIAGTGHRGYMGDGGPAAQALLDHPDGLAVDSASNLYVADTGNNRVRRIAPDGTITTVAGTGEEGFAGDGGLAAEALLNAPSGVATDTNGNVYVADTGNHCVRRIAADGTITTVAGTGERGFGGDGGPAAEAQLNAPSGVATDASGNVYVADTSNNRVRVVAQADGTIATVAGTGWWGDSGDGGPAVNAWLRAPSALALDEAGNLYIAETYSHKVRRVAVDGQIMTIAGTGQWGDGDDGQPGTEVSLAYPRGIAINASGDLFLADSSNHKVRAMRPLTQVVVPLGESRVVLGVLDGGALAYQGQPVLAGTVVTAEDGTSHTLQLGRGGYLAGSYRPELVVPVDAAGDPQLPSGFPGTADRLISTLAGRQGLDYPYKLAVDLEGNVYVADPRLHRVRRIDPDGAVTTIAGTGAEGYGGDGGSAKVALLSDPHGVAVDSDGFVIITDTGNNRVRRIDADGVITTIAGTGERGDGGDGGPATMAQLNRPYAAVPDSAGNIYVADRSNSRVRRIDSQGVITTFAGTGESGNSGDGGPATEAQLNRPFSLAIDEANNVYVVERELHLVRKVDSNGVISTIAGTGSPGFAGDGGPGSLALLNRPYQVAVDSAGNVYIADRDNGRVRRVDSNGLISTVAGTGDLAHGGDGGPASEAQFRYPSGLAIDKAGNWYVAELSGDRVRVIEPKVLLALGTATAVLGVAEGGVLTWNGETLVTGSEVWDQDWNKYALDIGSSGVLEATFVPEEQSVELPDGSSVTLTKSTVGIWKVGETIVESVYSHSVGGNEYVLEFLNGKWGLAPYVIRSVVGTNEVPERIAATAAIVKDPCGVAVDGSGNVYVGTEHRVRRINPAGVIETVAGIGSPGYRGGDGLPATNTTLSIGRPCPIEADGVGNIFVGENLPRVRKIDAMGVISTFVGTGEWGFAGDGGLATSARIQPVRGLASDGLGNLLVADPRNHRVRRVDSNGFITTIAGTGDGGFGGDGGPATEAQLNFPQGLAVDTAGTIFVADGYNHRVRRIDINGVITTLAGMGDRGYGGDGGPATEAQLFEPRDVATDAVGNVFVADTRNQRIRKIDINGVITTLAGTGVFGYGGDGGPAMEAQLSIPTGVAVDANGSVLVADTGNSRVRKIHPDGTIATLAGTGLRTPDYDQRPASSAILDWPWGLVSDSLGNLYFADTNQDRVWKLDTTGIVTVFAGQRQRERGFSGDGGPATQARLFSPRNLSIDGMGNIYVVDLGNARVRKIDTNGVITTIAGTGEWGYSGDGQLATEAQLDLPTGIAVDSAGNVYVAVANRDRNENVIRRIDLSGLITRFAARAAPNRSFGMELAVDKTSGQLYAATTGSREVSEVLRIGADGQVTVVAKPERTINALATDSEGNLYAAESRRILKIDAAGATEVIAGTGEYGGLGDEGRARDAQLAYVRGIAVDQLSRIWIADASNRRIRRLDPQ